MKLINIIKAVAVIGACAVVVAAVKASKTIEEVVVNFEEVIEKVDNTTDGKKVVRIVATAGIMAMGLAICVNKPDTGIKAVTAMTALVIGYYVLHQANKDWL